MDARIERGFEPPPPSSPRSLTTSPIVALHSQVNAIETQLRGMQHTKLHARVADLEEKVFGRARD